MFVDVNYPEVPDPPWVLGLEKPFFVLVPSGTKPGPILNQSTFIMTWCSMRDKQKP